MPRGIRDDQRIGCYNSIPLLLKLTEILRRSTLDFVSVGSAVSEGNLPGFFPPFNSCFFSSSFLGAGGEWLEVRIQGVFWARRRFEECFSSKRQDFDPRQGLGEFNGNL